MSTGRDIAVVTPRIDRLSSLPNELLEIIFDFAYYEYRPTGPLSKRLLSFHERGLYREIIFTSVNQAARLYQSLALVSLKGEIVKEIYPPEIGHFEEDEDETFATFFESLTLILPLCPRLRILDVQPRFGDPDSSWRASGWNSHSSSIAGLLQVLPLKFLALSLNQEDHENWDILAGIQEHASLKELSISYWDREQIGASDLNRSLVLPGIMSLQVAGISVDTESISSLIKMCPSLLHLDLFCTYDGKVCFDKVLPFFPDSLHSLSLDTEWKEVTPCDPFLSRFTSLRSITLGGGTFSPSLHLVLRQLPLLEKIKLGRGVIKLRGFRTLITGTSRLQHIRQVDLDLLPTSRGRRLKRRDASWKGWEFKAPHEDTGWKWKQPVDDELWLTISRALSDYIEAGKEHGIVVNSNIQGFERYRQAYALELFNRSMFTAFYQSNFQEIPRARLAAQSYSWLPPDVDSEGVKREQLELFETPVPELDWFVVSVRRKDKGSA